MAQKQFYLNVGRHLGCERDGCGKQTKEHLHLLVIGRLFPPHQFRLLLQQATWHYSHSILNLSLDGNITSTVFSSRFYCMSVGYPSKDFAVLFFH